ncbi:MAG: pyrroline-5-carboxylate reductase [Clostridiales Family XIII bacterium]|jgi:pyrroline-5-carboxylate reductase|nr:pyrroline-5-carboxylate reductase [Clostridiales Family XIII bacterium]
MKIGILGAGNMGGAIARGYAQSLAAAADGDRAGAPGEDGRVFVFDPDASKPDALGEVPRVAAVADEAELLDRSDAVIFAIKPQMFAEVVPRIASLNAGRASDGGTDEAGLTAKMPEAAAGKVFVSIAAGVSIAWLQDALGAAAKIIRVMPNTPAMVGEGMSAIARSASVTDAEFREVAGVFGAVGRVAEVSENLLDAVTGISGSSPAYAYMYIQALIESGVRHGLGEKEARIMAAQSTLGAAKMVLENEDVSVEQMRINVCSPGGTTIEAVHTLEKEGFMDAVKRAVYACVEKSKRMKL